MCHDKNWVERFSAGKTSRLRTRPPPIVNGKHVRDKKKEQACGFMTNKQRGNKSLVQGLFFGVWVLDRGQDAVDLVQHELFVELQQTQVVFHGRQG